MKLVYCSANIYLLLYISHFLLIISCRHLKHTADKCTCAWEFKKPFIFCFITLRCIQAEINEQLTFFNIVLQIKIFKTGTRGVNIWPLKNRIFIELLHLMRNTYKLCTDRNSSKNGFLNSLHPKKLTTRVRCGISRQFLAHLLN